MESSDTVAIDVWEWVMGGDHNASEPGFENGIDTGRGFAEMAAWFECDVNCGA